MSNSAKVSIRGRALLVSAAVALGALVTTHPAAAQAPRLALAGTTKIIATASSSSARVDVSRDVAFSGQCYPESAATLSGTAAAVVVALIPVHDPGNAVYFGRFPRQEGGHTFSSLCGGGATLKAGSYTLVMVRTAGTATLTLRLSGLAGRRVLRPSASHAGARIATLSPVAPYNSTGSMASFGASGSLASKGLVMVFGWMRSGVSAVATLGDCEVGGPLASLAPMWLAQAPGCPLGGSGFNVPGPKGSGTDFHGGGIANVNAGPYSAGFYYLSQAAADSAGGLAVWIPNAS